ncbi:MAG: hypothetical protein IAI50_03845 [Candidatus Eremiobacteraeota bacterium]|nr:hypothetical protein [Candidatus Eremiobacteraeota bacterium]
MQDTPPRRSRRPPPSDSGGSFPLVPIILGTIVVGFVIGAGLSIAGKREPQTISVATSSPTIQATLAPATFAPTEKPTREPTNEPQTEAPATETPPTATPATEAPRAVASRAARAATTTAPAAGASATLSHETHSPNSAAPLTSAAAKASASSSVTSAVPPASADDVDTDFGRLAASVVRGYLNAVARGDSASAASSLANSSDSVTEGSVVDATTRIKHVEARGVGDAATVNVDFETSTGAYFGQYTVRRTPNGAAVIVAHTIIKP